MKEHFKKLIFEKTVEKLALKFFSKKIELHSLLILLIDQKKEEVFEKVENCPQWNRFKVTI